MDTSYRNKKYLKCYPIELAKDLVNNYNGKEYPASSGIIATYSLIYPRAEELWMDCFKCASSYPSWKFCAWTDGINGNKILGTCCQEGNTDFYCVNEDFNPCYSSYNDAGFWYYGHC